MVERLALLADDAGLSLVHLALAFVRQHPAVTSAIIGPRTMEHLEDQLAATDLKLSDDLLDAIDGIVAPGTNRQRRPTPGGSRPWLAPAVATAG